MRLFNRPAALLLLVLAGTTAHAQTSSASTVAGATTAPVNQSPASNSWLTWGGDVRARDEYFDTAVSLSKADALHEQNLLRFRTRLWATAQTLPDLAFNIRLTAEPRHWTKPSFASAYKARTGTEWRYVIPDALNAKWSNALGHPITVTVGRQDILPGDLGDGWLIGDGTPADGSMTAYLDAARIKYKSTELNTEFNLVCIYQSPSPDAWLPVLGRSTSYPLVEQREKGVIVYASNKSITNVRLDGYFLYKHDDQETFTVAGVKKIPGDNADLYTLGASINGSPSANWQYSLEGAYQFGWKEDKIQGVFASRDVTAYGAKAKLTYLFKDALNNQLSLIGEHLSGDKAGTTSKDEAFDVMWGRWPRFSEAYANAFTVEAGGRPAQYSNLERLGASWTCNPTKQLTLSTTYNALFAPEASATRGPVSLFSNNGHFRGHFAQVLLKFQINKQLSGHVHGEWIKEGDYYRQRDVMTFFRVEMMYTF
jgi:hypothetical protein